MKILKQHHMALSLSIPLYRFYCYYSLVSKLVLWYLVPSAEDYKSQYNVYTAPKPQILLYHTVEQNVESSAAYTSKPT